MEGLTALHQHSIWHFEVNHRAVKHFESSQPRVTDPGANTNYIFPFIVPDMACRHHFTIDACCGIQTLRHLPNFMTHEPPRIMTLMTRTLEATPDTRAMLEMSAQCVGGSKIRVTVDFGDEIHHSLVDMFRRFVYDFSGFEKLSAHHGIKEFEVVILTDGSRVVSAENLNAMTTDFRRVGKILVPDVMGKETMSIEEGE
jgi:hypothetical protein